MTSAEIKYKLELFRISQTEIAKKLNVSQAVVSQVINGQRTSKHIAKAISAVIQLPLNKVFPAYEQQAA